MQGTIISKYLASQSARSIWQKPLTLALGLQIQARLRAPRRARFNLRSRCTLEAGKPFYNLDSSFMKLQGLPSGEVIAMVCHSAEKGCLMRWDPSAGYYV